MPSLMTNVKNIMRDLVNNKQIQVSFSISYNPKNSYNEETNKWDGPLILKRNIMLWFGDYYGSDKYFFKADYELLSFLNEFRKAINKNRKEFLSSLEELVKITYATLERKKKKSV